MTVATLTTSVVPAVGAVRVNGPYTARAMFSRLPPRQASFSPSFSSADARRCSMTALGRQPCAPAPSQLGGLSAKTSAAADETKAAAAEVPESAAQRGAAGGYST